MPGMVRIFLNRDFIGDLQAKAKVIGHLVCQCLQILDAGESVVGGVDANGFEDFRVFRQTITLESFRRDLAAIFVARWSVELSEPALIFPTRCADKNISRRQPGDSFFHPFTVESHVEMLMSF